LASGPGSRGSLVEVLVEAIEVTLTSVSRAAASSRAKSRAGA